MDYIRLVVYTPDFAIYGILYGERRSNGGQFAVFYNTVKLRQYFVTFTSLAVSTGNHTFTD